MAQNTRKQRPFKVSITVPCLNEVKNIGTTIKVLCSVMADFSDYEIIIVNDGSTDNTKSYIQENFLDNPKISLINHSVTMGRGYSIKEGFSSSKFDYLVCFNGKHDIPKEEVIVILDAIGSEELIVSYQANTHERPPIRRLFSVLYTLILNLSFGLNLKYFNGSCVLKKSDFSKLKLHSDNYALDAEILIKLIKSGIPFLEVPVNDIIEPERRTRSLTTKNILGVFIFYVITIWEIHFLKRRYK